MEQKGIKNEKSWLQNDNFSIVTHTSKQLTEQHK
jgi:hypothetical protein